MQSKLYGNPYDSSILQLNLNKLINQIENKNLSKKQDLRVNLSSFLEKMMNLVSFEKDNNNDIRLKRVSQLKINKLIENETKRIQSLKKIQNFLLARAKNKLYNRIKEKEFIFKAFLKRFGINLCGTYLDVRFFFLKEDFKFLISISNLNIGKKICKMVSFPLINYNKKLYHLIDNIKIKFAKQIQNILLPHIDLIWKGISIKVKNNNKIILIIELGYK